MHFKSTKFLAGLVKSPNGLISKTTCIAVGDKQYELKHFKEKRGRKYSTILLFGGFSVHGYKDVRLNNLARAIAKSGYRAIIVSMPDIEDLRISSELIADSKELILHICENTSYAKNGKVSLLAPSFSAGMLLSACADKQLQDKINVICCIGTFASISSSFDFILDQHQVDDYARNILFKNLLKYSEYQDRTDLKSIVEIAIQDNGHKRAIPQLPALLEHCNQSDVEVWNAWNNSLSFRKDWVAKTLSRSIEVQMWFKQYNVVDYITDVKFPVVFLHGESDDVIPKSESILLHQLRIKQQLPSHIFITNLITHGDSIMPAHKIYEVFQLAKLFRFFFKYAG